MQHKHSVCIGFFGVLLTESKGGGSENLNAQLKERENPNTHATFSIVKKSRFRDGFEAINFRKFDQIIRRGLIGKSDS